MKESIQHKLDRVRPPRVQITYDLELGGAVQRKQLPLVMGIMADLSGKPETALPPLKKRKFVEIDRDNINKVLFKSKPRVSLQVDNKIIGDGKLNVDLKFRTIDDFGPLEIVRQVPALAALLRKRQHLTDLLAKLDGNDRLEDLLQEVVASTEQLEEVRKLAEPTVAEWEEQLKQQAADEDRKEEESLNA